jgi:hypothetical protein
MRYESRRLVAAAPAHRADIRMGALRSRPTGDVLHSAGLAGRECVRGQNRSPGVGMLSLPVSPGRRDYVRVCRESMAPGAFGLPAKARCGVLCE